MDCRNFKDMLDSFLCQELAVETNHAILDHAEHCPPCRAELASRRNLRASLRRACSRDQMSEEACLRLRERLRAEAGSGKTADSKKEAGWRERFGGWLRAPVWATAAIFILIAGAFALYRIQKQAGTGPIPDAKEEALEAPMLSAALMVDAAADHRMCTHYVTPGKTSDGMPDSVKTFDEACLGLEKIVSRGAQGLHLQLSSAHVCGLKDGRRFAHLIYNQDGHLVSLLVTPRDERAIKAGQILPADIALTGLQQSRQGELALGAYQTAKRVVLVVSELPTPENEKLARTLALPVVTYLRQVESQTAGLNFPGVDLIASVRGGEQR